MVWRLKLPVRGVANAADRISLARSRSGRLPAEQRALLMPLWRLRAHMAFLVNNLQYYLQVDVLEAQWQAFMTVAETCADFEELTAAHEACLAALHAQCFLQARAQRPQSSRVHHGWCGTGLGGGWSVVGRGCALGDESRPPLLELPVLPSRAGFICLDRPPPDFPAVPLPLPHALIRREGRTGRDHLPGAVCHRLARVQQAVSLPLRLPIQHVLAAAVAALCVPPQRSSLAPNIPLPCAHALVPAGSVRQHTCTRTLLWETRECAPYTLHMYALTETRIASMLTHTELKCSFASLVAVAQLLLRLDYNSFFGAGAWAPPGAASRPARTAAVSHAANDGQQRTHSA